MMVNRPKAIGTTAETAIVRAARTRGFPGADRLTLTGNKDRGDIGLCPGIIIESKSGQAAKTASDNQILAWLEETETERVNANAAYGFLVTARAGVGPANAHRWWSHVTMPVLLDLLDAPPTLDIEEGVVRMTLDTLLSILTATGWGDPR